MKSWVLDSLTPVSAGAPFGMFAASDFAPGDDRTGVLRSDGEGHRVVIGPPGSGKFTSVIAPLLLTADHASIVVFDVKDGEATHRAYHHRASLGPVAVLDPFGASGLPADKLARLNPLDLLKPGSRDLLETATRLADAIFTPSGGKGDDDYWNDSAKELLLALLIHVATSPDEKQRTLTRVREIIRRPIGERLLASMAGNDEAGGVICDAADNVVAAIEANAEKQTFYVQQTLRANTRFLDLPSVQESTAETTLDLRGLRSQVSTLFVVVPEYQLGAVGRWLRLVYSVVLEEMRLGGLTAGRVPLHIVMDEFPALGPFGRVASDMALVRSYGIHFHVIVQTLMQLQQHYGQGWQTFLAAAKWQQILGANDQFTADYVSRRLGTTTRESRSESANRSAGGGSQGTGRAWMAAPLMAPHEVAQLDPARSLVLVEGAEPLNLRKWHYFDSDYLRGRVKDYRT